METKRLHIHTNNIHVAVEDMTKRFSVPPYSWRIT